MRFASFVPVLRLCAATSTACLGCGAHDDGGPRAAVTIESAAGLYSATARATPDPPRIGRNALELVVRDRDGTPLSGAILSATTFMPAHAHGATAPPAIVDVGGGRYAVSDVVYSMPGLWSLAIEVRGPSGVDRMLLEYEVR
jgi:hypothetical protein